MNCPNCDSTLEGKEIFCEHCGFQLKEVKEGKEISEEGKKGNNKDAESNITIPVVISKPLAQKLINDSEKLNEILSAEKKKQAKNEKPKKEKKKRKNSKIEGTKKESSSIQQTYEKGMKALEYISDKIKQEKDFQRKFNAMFPGD